MTCEQNYTESIIAFCVGIIGCFLGFIANTTQVYHMYKKKHVEGISIWYIILLLSLAIMFSIYSIVLNLIPILLLNIPYGITNLIMLYYYFYGKKPTVISTRSEMELVNVNSTRVDIDDTRVIIAIDDDIKSLSPSLSEGI